MFNALNQCVIQINRTKIYGILLLKAFLKIDNNDKLHATLT